DEYAGRAVPLALPRKPRHSPRSDLPRQPGVYPLRGNGSRFARAQGAGRDRRRLRVGSLARVARRAAAGTTEPARWGRVAGEGDYVIRSAIAAQLSSGFQDCRTLSAQLWYPFQL